MALCHLDYGFVPNVFTCSYVPNIFVDDSVSIIFTEGCAPVILLSLMAMCRSYYSYLWLCATYSVRWVCHIIWFWWLCHNICIWWLCHDICSGSHAANSVVCSGWVGRVVSPHGVRLVRGCIRLDMVGFLHKHVISVLFCYGPMGFILNSVLG